MDRLKKLKSTSTQGGSIEPSAVLSAAENLESEIQNSASNTDELILASRKSSYLNPKSEIRNPKSQGSLHEPCYAVNPGIMDYNQAWKLQSDLVAARLDGSIDRDIILFLEHPAVFTLGRRGGREYLLVGESFLEQAGIAVVQVERGGYITYHGPGQLVVYTIIDLEARRLGVKDFVAALEDIMLQTVRTWGLTAQRNSANPGIWMGPRKMGSIGIALRKGVSFHGLSLNINVDLDPFSWIQPCGLQGVSMTSVKQELGEGIPMDAVHRAVKEGFKSVLNLALDEISYPDLRQQLISRISRNGRLTIED